MFDLDDVFLLLIRDAEEVPHHWLNRWEVSYPLSQTVTVCVRESEEAWRQKISDALATIDHHVMIVAHRAGCNAFASWLFYAGVSEQRRIRGAILAAPLHRAWSDNPSGAMNRARVNFRTALVAGENDPDCPLQWAQALAHRLGAKYLTAPQYTHLNQALNGWQWGMRLMQDILLD